MKTIITLLALTLFSQAYGYDLTKKLGFGASLGYPIPVFGNQFNSIADPEWAGSLYLRYNTDSFMGVDLGVSKETFKDTSMYFENINLLPFWRMAGAANATPILGLGVGLTRIHDYIPRNSKLSILARLGFEYAMSSYMSFGAMADYQYVSKILGKMPTGAAHIIKPQIAFTWYFGSGEGAPAEEKKEEKKEEKTVETEKNNDVITTGQASTAREEGPELTIEFDTDKAVIKDTYIERIKEVAEQLKDSNDLIGLVEGHADSTGSNAHNDKLSQRRANEVRKKLMEYGVEKSRIKVDSFGEDRPIADNSTAEGRQKNRRAEVTISVIKKISGM